MKLGRLGVVSCLMSLCFWNVFVFAGSTDQQSAAQHSAAHQPAAQELVARLQKIESFQAKFKQLLSDRNGEELQFSEGELKLKKPGKFLWQVKPPYEQLVVSNGVKLWVYDADLEQATVRSSQQLQNTPAEILSGDFSSIQMQYSVTGKSLEKKVIQYDLVPIESSDFASMAFTFKKDRLVSFAINDKLGQQTLVTFTSTKVNKKLNGDIFNFLPPEGTDIIVNDE